MSRKILPLIAAVAAFYSCSDDAEMEPEEPSQEPDITCELPGVDQESDDMRVYELPDGRPLDILVPKGYTPGQAIEIVIYRAECDGDLNCRGQWFPGLNHLSDDQRGRAYKAIIDAHLEFQDDCFLMKPEAQKRYDRCRGKK
ncbi:hypothetical protein ACFL0V_05270 [Nanoarchaeota archaeon]